MHVLTVAQNKGGEGKTVISRLLGEWGAREGYRTLLIDMDAQANLSQRFLVMDVDQNEPDGILPPVHPDFRPEEDGDWGGRSSVVDIYGVTPSQGVIPYQTPYPKLDIIPGWGREMRRLELRRADEVKEHIHERLREWVLMPEVQDSYDLIIIDTPPTKGPLVVSAVRAATHMLIPCKMEPQSMEGLRGMLQLWRRENGQRTAADAIHMIGILPNMFQQRTRLHEDIRGALLADPAIGGYILPVSLCRRVAFAEHDSPEAKPRSIFERGDDVVCQEATNVCRFVFDVMAGKDPNHMADVAAVEEASA